MGDPTDADQFLTRIHDTYAPDWGSNWYDDEAGWFILGVTATGP
jgi:hypothetical protein